MREVTTSEQQGITLPASSRRSVLIGGRHLGRRGAAVENQFLLLTGTLILSVIYHPVADPHGLKAVVVAMIAVSAMGCQFGLLRLALPGAPSTAVMTGNLTNTVLSLLDTLSRSRPVTEFQSSRPG